MGKSEPSVAVITGASQGIGAGLVGGYRDHGWSVVANSREMKPSSDPQVLVVDGDIAEPATADRIVDHAMERFGHIDTLVNNAGLFISKPFTEYTPQDYDRVVGVNLTGFFCLTQRVIAEMVKAEHGHVVNISASVVDYAHSSEPSVLASLTKGGIAAATKSLAVEYATRGIRVNAVAPGVIKTPMHSEREYAAGAKLAPMERVGDVTDIVDGILFLESAPFVTGEVLHIDGGQIAGR
ncbi:MAG TPA: SDR family NAD(P)-dependent oxidoreductase [Streptosporangiaceae bacterium]|nr:SDR family NAD(P)-dependent oxidoreductase [Streptosporangiaceae bacterium]